MLIDREIDEIHPLLTAIKWQWIVNTVLSGTVSFECHLSLFQSLEKSDVDSQTLTIPARAVTSLVVPSRLVFDIQFSGMPFLTNGCTDDKSHSLSECFSN